MHGWLSTGAYWSPGVSREVVERSLAQSWVVGAYDERGQLGLARLVGDRTTFAWLCDVFVAEAARGRGVGRALVEAAVDQAAVWGVRRLMLATKDAHALYASYGFTPLPDGRFLELRGEALSRRAG